MSSYLEATTDLVRIQRDLAVTGNVGIGTAAPLQKLHVVGNTRIEGNAVITGNWEVQGTTTYIDTYTAVTSNVTINNASGNGPALRVTQSGVGANYPIADFYDSDVSSTVPALRIADGGNVGVGTANPQYKLHVEDVAYFPKGIISPGIQAQSVLSGGGVVTWTGASLKWSQRVIAIPVEKAEFALSGYISINCPLSDTIVYYSGNTGVSTATCDANGIPLGVYNALWYVVTVGQSHTSVQGNFVLTEYNNDTWRPTSNWLLIAANNGEGHLKWLPGQINIPNTGGIYNSQLGTNNWTTAVSVQASDGTAAAPSIAFSSDLDTGMYHPGADKLGLVTAGVERVSVLDNGNVGIGQTNPQELFHINTFAQNLYIQSYMAFSHTSLNNIPVFSFNALHTKTSRDYKPVYFGAGAGTSFITGGSGGGTQQTLIFRHRTVGTNNAAFDLFNDTNESMRLDASGIVSQVTYNTVAAGSGVVVDSGGRFYRTNSSIKYKTNIEDLNQSVVSNAIDRLRPVWYRSKYANGDDSTLWSHIGLIAEEVHEVEPRLVRYRTIKVENVNTTDGEGNVTSEQKEVKLDVPEPEDVDYSSLAVILLAEIQTLKARILALESSMV